MVGIWFDGLYLTVFFYIGVLYTLAISSKLTLKRKKTA